jgi:hypothetical protein
MNMLVGGRVVGRLVVRRRRAGGRSASRRAGHAEELLRRADRHPDLVPQRVGVDVLVELGDVVVEHHEVFRLHAVDDEALEDLHLVARGERLQVGLELVALLRKLGRVVGLLQLLDQRLDAREVVLRVLDAAHGDRVAAVFLLVDDLQHAEARDAGRADVRLGALLELALLDQHLADHLLGGRAEFLDLAHLLGAHRVGGRHRDGRVLRVELRHHGRDRRVDHVRAGLLGVDLLLAALVLAQLLEVVAPALEAGTSSARCTRCSQFLTTVFSSSVGSKLGFVRSLDCIGPALARSLPSRRAGR